MAAIEDTVNVPVTLWSAGAGEGPVEMEYDGHSSRVLLQRTDKDEVALHVLPPDGTDESEADLTIYMTVRDAEACGMGLIREAKA